VESDALRNAAEEKLISIFFDTCLGEVLEKISTVVNNFLLQLRVAEAATCIIF